MHAAGFKSSNFQELDSEGDSESESDSDSESHSESPEARDLTPLLGKPKHADLKR